MKERQTKIKQLLDNANTILNKYDNDYVRPQETFIHAFDKYIFHTIEEVYEARQATEEEFVEEVADILNYTTTMIEILKANLKKGGYPIFKFLPHNEMRDIEQAKRLLAFIYDDLVSMRRKFPQRKWHKNEKSDDFTKVLNECLMICVETMSALFDLIGFDRLIDIALEKQKKVIGLELVNK